MEHALAPGRETFDQKMIVRKAIEDANIPFTYVSANCFAGYFVGNLSQPETLIPPKDKVRIYGDGNVKGKQALVKKKKKDRLVVIYAEIIFVVQLFIWTRMTLQHTQSKQLMIREH